MRFGALTLLSAVIVAVSACSDEGSDDNVTWTAQFTGSEDTDSSAGGTVIEVNSKVVVGTPAWVVDDAAPFQGEVPLPDLSALGDALARTDWEVVDALLTAEGTVALLRTEGRIVLLLLEDGPDSAAHLPEGAIRLLPAGERPLKVLVLTEDGLAAPATRTLG